MSQVSTFNKLWAVAVKDDQMAHDEKVVGSNPYRCRADIVLLWFLITIFPDPYKCQPVHGVIDWLIDIEVNYFVVMLKKKFSP